MHNSTILKKHLAQALAAKGADYYPRTRHLLNGRPVYTNRLILEDSPYLLQHAHNPVNWYSWGQEAFADAKQENKLIFLSIGYATCHWCHVMEEESFENPEVAKLLNAHFISIKIDREVHPDIDQLYMTAVMMMTGRGGWPMSSFLTPDGKPFFSGTYFKPLAFIDLIEKIQQTWVSQPTVLLEQAKQLADAVQTANLQDQTDKLPEPNLVDAAVDSILYNYDSQYGGFSSSPKFPNEPLLLLLVQHCLRAQTSTTQTALEHTLNAMAQGGLYDQVGGGFHRYSVDNYWLVPHFEKMLYNQAYLCRIYSAAYQLTGVPYFARIVKQTADYILREMRTETGLFYSATDADSEGEEGLYFLWSKAEIKHLLAPPDSDFICRLYGISEQGNFEGKNILHLPVPLNEFAQQDGVSFNTLVKRIDPLLQRLRIERAKRIAPLTDKKVITAWNGMMVTALLEAGECLKQQNYIDIAKQTAEQLWRSQTENTQSLWRINLNGIASVPAKLEDYAHLTESLIYLYDIKGETKYLQQAKILCDRMLSDFGDNTNSALNMGNEALAFAQMKESYDSALPSGNAVAVRVLSRLSRRLGDPAYLHRAHAIIKYFGESIRRQPAAYAYLLAQLDEMTKGEISPRQFYAQGAVKAFANLNGRHISVQIDIGPNVSIYAENISLQILHPSDIALHSLQYPKPTHKTVAFQDSPLALFEHSLTIEAVITETEIPVSQLNMSLQLQCCLEQCCLPKESHIFTLFSN